jgi:RNA polymerase-binding transcription factor DksA
VPRVEIERVLAVVDVECERTQRQIESLQRSVASIVEAAELTSTDDEHDPEGATIAYERAQATALLRQAIADLDALAAVRASLMIDQEVACVDCRRPIDLERLAALPTARRCIRCAA